MDPDIVIAALKITGALLGGVLGDTPCRNSAVCGRWCLWLDRRGLQGEIRSYPAIGADGNTP